jgi:hypothetical protein
MVTLPAVVTAFLRLYKPLVPILDPVGQKHWLRTGPLIAETC